MIDILLNSLIKAVIQQERADTLEKEVAYTKLISTYRSMIHQEIRNVEQIAYLKAIVGLANA